MFKTHNDLSEDVRGKVIAILNQQLADTTDLFTQTKYAHWNVKGPQFIALHKLFDELAGELLEATDEIAERATALGGVATGTVRQAAKATKLAEFPAGVYAGDAVVAELASRYGVLAASTRKAIDATAALGDADTADLFTGFSRELDKALWFIEAHRQG